MYTHADAMRDLHTEEDRFPEARVTEEQARAVLVAVRAHYRHMLEPFEVDGETFTACYGPDDQPELVMSYYEGVPAIVWEAGPSDWAMHTDGSPSEQDYVDAHDLAQELGVECKPAGREPLRLPAGVAVEPVYSYALGIYLA